MTHPDKEPEDDWKPPPWRPPLRVVVNLEVPDGVELVLEINGVRLMPEDDH